MRKSIPCFVIFLIRYASAIQEWIVNISDTNVGDFNFWFNKCVGSGHASLALRQDWQNAMITLKNELDIEYVRFHGILDDDVGSYNGVNDYSFVNVFKIYDFLLSINMKPYVEISFMPYDLRSGECYILHYNGNVTPPKSYTEWNNFIFQWLNETVSRYGIDEVSQWAFEVWNVK